MAASLGVAIQLFIGTGVASADTYVVNRFIDSNRGGACNGVADDCSLREAVNKANLGSGHVVSIPSGTYTLSIVGSGEDLGATGDLDVRAAMTISGAGASTTTIRGQNGWADRIIDVVSPGLGITVHVSGVTISNGEPPSNEDGGGARLSQDTSGTFASVHITGNRARQGGGIATSGTNGSLILSRSTVSSNRSTGAGGGLFLAKATASVQAIEYSTIAFNESEHNASAVAQYGSGTPVEIFGSTIVENRVSLFDASRGALQKSTGTISLKYSIVSDNYNKAGVQNCTTNAVTSLGRNISSDTSCGLGGTGDIEGQSPKLGPFKLNGGQTPNFLPLPGGPAIDVPGSLVDCRATSPDQRGFSRNVDGNADGSAACDIGAVESRIAQVTRFDDVASVSAPSCQLASSPSLNGCSLRSAIREINNNGSLAEGVIALPAGTYTLTLAGGNEANSATGDLDTQKPITIVGAGADRTIIQAGTTPGALGDRVFEAFSDLTLVGVTVRHGQGGDGGGFRVQSGRTDIVESHITNNLGTNGGGIATTGDVRLDRSSITHNTTGGTQGGAGIHNSGAGTVNLLNSTVSTNTAAEGASGIYGGATLNNSTIASNVTNFSGNPTDAGIVGTAFTMTNSIVANNSNVSGQRNCSVTDIFSGGYNATSDTSCPPLLGANDVSNANPQLGPLQLNGGTTPSHSPLVGSPVVDDGNDIDFPGFGANACSRVDQRGKLRPKSGGPSSIAHCDKGAVELDRCDPRPNASVSVARISGNLLRASVSAGIGELTAVHFGNPTAPTNAKYSIQGGPQNLLNAFLYNSGSSPALPPGTTQVIVDLRQQAFGSATTLPFTLTDFCGPWKSFVGGGTGAYTLPPSGPEQPSAAAQPTPAPTATPSSLVPGSACASFPTHAAAQAHLRAHPTDPLLLDTNRNGIACEGSDGAGFVNPPLDQVPVPRP